MIGIMSDSHDNLEAIAKAVEFFNQQKVSLVLHAGDIISPFTTKEFKKLQAPLKLVYGNNDGEKKGLEIAFKQMNADISELNEVEHEGKKLRYTTAQSQYYYLR
jgi:putative phosphoesterase